VHPSTATFKAERIMLEALEFFCFIMPLKKKSECLTLSTVFRFHLGTLCEKICTAFSLVSRISFSMLLKTALKNGTCLEILAVLTKRLKLCYAGQ
jgi:hypothetical protein